MNAITPVGDLAKRIVAGCAAARERRWRLSEMVAALKHAPGLPDDNAADLDRIEAELLAGAETDPDDQAGVRALYYGRFGERSI